MESFSGLLDSSPKATVRAFLFVILGLAIAVELLASRIARRRVYDKRDVWVNFRMYLGYLVIYAGFVYILMPLMIGFWSSFALMPMGKFWWRADSLSVVEWIVLFLLVDIAFYVYHYCCHHTRFFWASHVGHHSSRHFNLTTGIRQPWVPLFPLFFWPPLVWIGYHPAVVVLAAALNLNFQILLHTRLIPSFGPFDWIFNSPSHHRVHHACNEKYRDKNLGGILILWDRMMGTFAEETEEPIYGIGAATEKNDVFENSFGEFTRLFRELKSQSGVARKISYALAKPGSTDSLEPTA